MYGYAHCDRLNEKQIGWRDLPARITRDPTPWLAEQRVKAQASGKAVVDSFLRDIEMKLRAV